MKKFLRLIIKIIVTLVVGFFFIAGQINPLRIGFSPDQIKPVNLGFPFPNFIIGEGLGFSSFSISIEYNYAGMILNLLIFVVLMFLLYKLIDKIVK